jgi:hypothetical protein
MSSISKTGADPQVFQHPLHRALADAETVTDLLA